MGQTEFSMKVAAQKYLTADEIVSIYLHHNLPISARSVSKTCDLKISESLREPKHHF